MENTHIQFPNIIYLQQIISFAGADGNQKNRFEIDSVDLFDDEDEEQEDVNEL